MGEWSDSLAVGEVDVGASVDEQADDLGVTPVAAAEDDRLEERGPAEPVDVVDFDLSREQALDNRDVPPIGCSDQARPVVAVLRVDVGSVGERELEQPRVVADLARGYQVGALLGLILRVDIDAGLDQLAGGASTSISAASRASSRSRSRPERSAG